MKLPVFILKLLALPHGDKIVHALVGFVISLSVGVLLSPWAGLVLAVVAGIGKEIYDEDHREEHTPDVWDSIATMAGGLLALPLSLWVGL